MQSFLNDLKFAARSLFRAKGLTITVVLTLALGIGANAAIFALVRGILLRPLVNRDEDRLVYIRQTAPGLGIDDAAFSVPEIQDFRDRVKTIAKFGDFSTIGFTMVGLGEPREIRAGVVGGNYFEVMGLHPVLGRLLDMRDDGPGAAGDLVPLGLVMPEHVGTQRPLAGLRAGCLVVGDLVGRQQQRRDGIDDGGLP